MSEQYQPAIVKEKSPDLFTVVDGGGWLNPDIEYTQQTLDAASLAMELECGKREDGKEWILFEG